MVNIKVNGNEYDLLFNGAAMFAIKEKFDGDNISDLIKDDTALCFQRACKIAVILAEQGELLRRYMGHTPCETLTEDELRLSISPLSIYALKNKLSEAMMDGYKREVTDENGEVDLGLAELNKKKVIP